MMNRKDMNLKFTIEQNPDCLASSRTVEGVLRDCGMDNRTVQVMVNLYYDGIVNKIRQCGGVLSRTEIYKLVTLQEKKYGTSQKFVEDGIQHWASAFGVKLESVPLPVQKKPLRSYIEPSLRSAQALTAKLCHNLGASLKQWANSSSPKQKQLSKEVKTLLGTLAVLFAFLILISLFADMVPTALPVSDTAKETQSLLTHGEISETIQWNLQEGVLTVSGTGAMPDFSYENPSPWEDQADAITSVLVEDGITYIGSNAFKYLSNLTHVAMEDSVSEIGNEAFYDCTNLENVHLSNNLANIRAHAFFGCESLRELEIPSSVTIIESYAFKGTSLTALQLSDQCRFSYLSFPPDMTVADGRPTSGSVGENITWELNASGHLTISGEGSLYVDDNLNTEAAPWYSQRNEIKSVSISEDITDLGGGVFANCNNLTNVKLPKGLLDIGYDTFLNCTSLTQLSLPGDIQSIGNGTFSGCTKLKNITIPSGVTEIGWETFRGCSSLTSINIPNSVTTISVRAFEGCSSLTSINIPNGVTVIDSGTFQGCSSLTNITIPNSITTIGSSAFQGCSNLTGINIPNGVTEIGNFAFEGCSSLTHVSIPNGVMEIANSAFKNCTNLATITLPKSIQKIDNSAFEGCSSLVNITLPNGVTEIGSSVFAGCTSLPRINIPNGVTEIDFGTFQRCISLTNITIPRSLSKISWSAFEDCTSLTSIVIPAKCSVESNAIPEWVDIAYFD